MAAEAQTGLSMTLRPSSCWQVPRHSPTRGGREDSQEEREEGEGVGEEGLKSL